MFNIDALMKKLLVIPNSVQMLPSFQNKRSWLKIMEGACISCVCVCVYINISQIKGRLSKASLDRVILRLRQNVWGNMPFIVSISFILRKPWPYILPTTSHVKGSYFFWRLVRDLLKSCITIDCLVTIQKSNHFNILWPWLNSCYEVTMEYDR